MLLNYQKKCPYECYYICVPKHSSDKDLLLLMSSAMGYYPYGDSSSLQMEIATHINNGGHPVVFLIDEIDNLCPKTARGGVTNLDKLDVVRVIWDLSRKFTCFILAAPYDLEAMIQKSGDKVSNSHVYRQRCQKSSSITYQADKARRPRCYR